MTAVFRFLLVLAGTLLLAVPVLAAGVSSPQPQTADSATIVNQARDLLYGKHYAKAIRLLKDGEAKDPQNANIHNLLGYSYRNQGDYALAKQHYDQALRIDPNHLGAHEYIGEMYLKLGQPEMAKDHLQRLQEICGDCEEFNELKTAIDKFEKR